MHSRWFAPKAIVAGALLVLGLAAAGPGLAQESATPGATGGMAMGPHPAHIHAGTCETLGDVVFPLEDVTHGEMMGTPMAGMEQEADATPAAGAADGTPMAGMGEVVAMSTSTVEAPLADILAAEHAINVHESAEAIDVYIACGDITGDASSGSLEIELAEDSNSGYSGRAMLTDNGDGTTTVDVMLMSAEDGAGEGGEAEATPSS